MIYQDPIIDNTRSFIFISYHKCTVTFPDPGGPVNAKTSIRFSLSAGSLSNPYKPKLLFSYNLHFRHKFHTIPIKTRRLISEIRFIISVQDACPSLIRNPACFMLTFASPMANPLVPSPQSFAPQNTQQDA